MCPHFARLKPAILVLIFFCQFASAAASAQDDQPVQFGWMDEIAEPLATLRQQFEANTTLDATAKEKLQGIIAAAESSVAPLASKVGELAELEQAIKTAAERSAEIQRDFEDLNSQEPEKIGNNLTQERLAERLLSQTAKIDSLKAELKTNEDTSTARNLREKDSRGQLEALTKKIEDLTSQLEQTSSDNSLLSQALVLKVKTERALAGVDKMILQAELQRDAAEQQVGLLKHEHDLLDLQLERSEAIQNQLEEIQRRQKESKAQRLVTLALEKEARAREAGALLLPGYEQSTRLAQLTLETEKLATETKADADRLREEVEALAKKFRDTETRVKEIGLTGSVGALLRKRRTELLESSKLQFLDEDAESQIDDLQYKLFEIDQQREELSREKIQLEIEEVGGPQPAEVWQQMEVEIDALIEARKEQLTAYKSSLNSLFPQLLDVQQFDRSRRKTARQFRKYINERILWIRSNNVLFSELKIDKSDLEILSPSAWQEVGSQILQSLGVAPTGQADSGLTESVTDNGKADTNAEYSSLLSNVKRSHFRLALSVIGTLICFLLLAFKSKMHKHVDELGEEASRDSTVSFWPTSRSLVVTVLIAISLPLIPLLLGLAIVYAPFPGSALFYALGRALIAASLFAIPAEVLRRMTRPNGIGNKHFDWPNSAVAKLKRNLDWVVLPGSILIFIVNLLHNLDLSHRVDVLERIFFVGGMIFAAYFLYKIFNTKSGIYSEYLGVNDKTWANQTSVLWVGVVLLVPISLAVLAFLGYYYTALNLAECGYWTLVFGLMVETVRGLARRFVLVRSRNALIQTAKRKRQAKIEALMAKREEERRQAIAAAAEGGTPLPEFSDAPVESLEALAEIQPEELQENAKQAYKLISMSLLILWAVGFWMIWTDVLPALKALDGYTLWPNQVVENGFESPSAFDDTSGVTDGGATQDSGDQIEPSSMLGVANTNIEAADPVKRVTVRDLLLFFVISIVTWIAAMNLPNAFEILFLEQLPFDRSLRYAVKSLTSYAIVLLGVVLAFRALSIGWSNVQWLATALTFGLAFGLQEIFANFVAGIILMFERPMRIGDLITVDQFTGVVTKIRTRATTIVNWDRKEYVIPNKDFITGRLVNWTLSDAINRIQFTIGVAYGSDVELAKSTLYDILKKHPKVVDDPPSQVVFSEFGESSLVLVVKCFIGDVDSRSQVTDSLHTLINEAFNEAGIEISFPQRDLHLRTFDSLPAELISGKAKKKEK